VKAKFIVFGGKTAQGRGIGKTAEGQKIYDIIEEKMRKVGR